MTKLMEKEEHYVAAFARAEDELRSGTPAWLHTLRKAAISRFAEMGFPTRRDEEWKYTNVAPLTAPFVPAPVSPVPCVDAAHCAPFFLPQLNGPRLVFVNGAFMPDLSHLHELPPGVILGGLAGGVQEQGEALAGILAHDEAAPDGPFEALNTAFFRDGLLLQVPEGVELGTVQVLHVLADGSEPMVSCPRSIITLGRGSRATLIETHASLDGGPHLVNARGQARVGEDAHFSHLRIQLDAASSYHVESLRVEQARASSYTSSFFELGGALVRNDVRVELAGEGAECNLHGLWIGDDKRHIDVSTVLEHARPHCNSRQIFKGILADRSRGIFSGMIHVHPDAQKTDAKQSNDNMLLSEDAIAHTRPRLEIYADDVRCTHGATVGQLDAEALFYMRSRGIAQADARNILTHAFASDVVNRIGIAPVRDRIEELIAARLPGGTSA